MRALTLWQPHATLMAMGKKPWETRSWRGIVNHLRGQGADMKLNTTKQKDDVTGNKNEHRSDCAVHNEPAYPNEPCDCGLAEQVSGKAEKGRNNEDGFT